MPSSGPPACSSRRCSLLDIASCRSTPTWSGPAGPAVAPPGGKSDRGDANLLADLLRTDGPGVRPLAPSSDELKPLRAVVRGRHDLVAQRVALANQLRALLEGFWSGAAAVLAEIESPIALAFLARYPTPNSAPGLGEKRVKTFMAQHASCGRRSAAEWLARLRAAPTDLAGEPDAKGELVRAQAGVLAAPLPRTAELSARTAHTAVELPGKRIVMPFPRAGRICAAVTLAKLADVHERFSSPDRLAAETGIAPITHQSGKGRSVSCRWACNNCLRRAIICLANNSRHASAWAAEVYRRARGRGCDHPYTIRILARAWIGVLWPAWSEGVFHDPDRHRAAKALDA